MPKITVQAIKTSFADRPFKSILFTLIILITIAKLFLVGDGIFSFPDESRYVNSIDAVQNISHLHFKEAAKNIFSTQGRPGDAIVKMIPAIFQCISAHFFKLKMYEPANTDVIFIFNYIIYCLVLIIYYKCASILLRDSGLAMISVFFWACLTNSYIYLRHALPYDTSLLIFYLILYFVIFNSNRDAISNGKSFFWGIASCFGYLVYPGYFPLFFAILFLLFINNLNKDKYVRNTLYATFFVAGIICCLLCFEALARVGGRSYLLDSYKLTNTINQGSFSECFSFIVKYLLQVEKLSGILLILGFVVFFILLLVQMSQKLLYQNKQINLVFLILITLFLTYASAGYFLHKMVLYGRLLHQYIPFLCIFSVFGFSYFFNKKTIQRNLFFVLITLILANFIVNFVNYKTVGYPVSMEWQIKNTYPLKSIAKQSEYKNVWLTSMDNKLSNDFLIIPSKNSDIILTNAFYFYPFDDLTKYNAFIPPAKFVLKESKAHFMNFPAYRFEGYNIKERENISTLNLQMKVFINESAR